MRVDMRVRDMRANNVQDFALQPRKQEDIVAKLRQEAEYLRQRLAAGLVFSQREKERLQDELKQVENDIVVLEKINKL